MQIKNILTNQLLSIFLIIISIYLSIFLCILDPIKGSISSIGRDNYFLYIVWCLTIILAIVFNIARYQSRLSIKDKSIIVLLVMGIVFFVQTMLNLYYYDNDNVYVYHMITGFSSAFFFSLTLLLCLIKGSKTRKLNWLLIMIQLIIYVLSVIIIIIKDFTSAIYQIIPIVSSLIVLLIINNIPHNQL